MKSNSESLENEIIAAFVEPGASVLDLGCGEGDLLSILVKDKKAKVQGIDIDEQAIYKCVARGLSVLHGDIDSGLSEYGDKYFDYVILNQSFQQVKKPDVVLQEALRVGKEVIVTFPNFGYWRNRLHVMLGSMPMSDNLPYRWFDTPNIHLCTITDFEAFCSGHSVRILERIVMRGGRAVALLPNLLGSLAVYRFERA